MKPTLRFKSYKEWRNTVSFNLQFFGIIDLINNISENMYVGSRMLEIGSYMGESTAMFAASGMFDEVHVLDPHEGYEEFNELFGWTWEDVKREWKLNTRHNHEIIHLRNEYSYNVHADFPDGYFDFIYIDGDHSYEGVRQDIELYLPKLRKGGIIGGHDYSANEWPGVVKAIHETLGKPDYVFLDQSWIKYL